MARPPKTFAKLWPLVGLAALITIYAAPLFIGVYSASLLRDAMLDGLMALELDYLLGKTSLRSCGHSTFFGAGAYGAAIVSTKLCLDLALGGWLGLLAGIALAATLALIIGYFLIYGGLRGSYLTIVTLALGVIAKLVVLGASGLTGGDAGLLGIPALHFPTLSGLQPLPDIGQYWFISSVVCGVTFAVWWACSGRYGALLKSIQDNERRAQALGYTTSAHLLAVFAGSAAIAALGGVLYASTVGVVATDSIDLALSTQAIIFVAICAIWRRWSGCHRRSRVDSKMHCIKLPGQRGMARNLGRKVAAFQVRVAVLKGYTAPGIFIAKVAGYAYPVI